MARNPIDVLRRLPLAIVAGALFCATSTPIASAATFLVTDCTDSGNSGTLRNTIAIADQTDDSIVEIPLKCSTITLSTGSITLSGGGRNLTVVGQGQSLTTIDGGSNLVPPVRDRVFNSTNSGTLQLEHMTIKHGMPPSDSMHSRGGCVYSRFDLYLLDTLVTDCVLSPVGYQGTTRGAGIYTSYSATLASSTVANNLAIGSAGQAALGAGVYARRGVTSIYSTVSKNTALAGASSQRVSRGGGMYVGGYYGGVVLIIDSTIAGNVADVNAAIQAGVTTASGGLFDMISSTVAGNYANEQAIGSYLNTAVTNSTIAFNHAMRSSNLVPPGLYSKTQITMQNSIFANNTSGDGPENDVFSDATSNLNPLTGSNNLIVATSEGVPSGTLTSCPKLGHLSNNGGLTETIPLLSGSPALDSGSGNGQPYDQRGIGFSRTQGSGADIGAYERQPGVVDDILFYAEFEARCD